MVLGEHEPCADPQADLGDFRTGDEESPWFKSSSLRSSFLQLSFCPHAKRLLPVFFLVVRCLRLRLLMQCGSRKICASKVTLTDTITVDGLNTSLVGPVVIQHQVSHHLKRDLFETLSECWFPPFYHLVYL